MNRIWIIGVLLFTQSCTQYCVPYGYLDFGSNQGAEVIEYISADSIPGGKDIGRFPGVYRVHSGGIVVTVETIAERGYPTVAISTKTEVGKQLEPKVEVEAGGQCLRAVESVWDKKVEVMWMTDIPHCKSQYLLRVHAIDDGGKKAGELDLDVELRRIGQKCEMDAL